MEFVKLIPTILIQIRDDKMYSHQFSCKLLGEHFTCNKKGSASGTSCSDPVDIEKDATRTWVIDKPNILRSPADMLLPVDVASNVNPVVPVIDVSLRIPNNCNVRIVKQQKQVDTG